MALDTHLQSLLLRLTLVSSISFLTACAGLETRPDQSSKVSEQITVDPDTGAVTSVPHASLTGKEVAAPDLTDSGADLIGVPMEVNRMVLMWIDYFQGQGRPHMERYLSRSTRYMPVMKQILKKEGLPEDLIYIALIESGFSSTAHSHANAVGYWQFIRGTGKRYGMKIDAYVDERRDFVRSTQGAAAYFKDLYNMFGAWYLAIASYNVGEGRVRRLVAENRTKDFWKLARENRLPEETRHYVPKYIAARLIAKEPEKYGFTDIDYMAPLEYSEIEVRGNVDLRKLAQGMGLDYDDIRDLNPSYKKGVAIAISKGSASYKLRVPKGTEEKAVAALGSAVTQSVATYVADEDYGYYKVRRGENLASIARKFNTTAKQIRELNNLKANSKLIAGRRIRVPGEVIGGVSPVNKSTGKKKSLATHTSSLSPLADQKSARKPSQATRVHIVRKGENLIEISRKYQISLNELTSHNKLGRQQKINVGTRLEIPQVTSAGR